MKKNQNSQILFKLKDDCSILIKLLVLQLFQPVEVLLVSLQGPFYVQNQSFTSKNRLNIVSKHSDVFGQIKW